MNRADRRRCPATGRRKHAWTTKSGEQYAGIEVCPDCGAMRDAATAVPVGVQPEPAEYVCVHGKRVTDHYCGDMAENDVAPALAVPVVHPEPASESSDSVAELVADTTRSGDRAEKICDRCARCQKGLPCQG